MLFYCIVYVFFFLFLFFRYKTIANFKNRLDLHVLQHCSLILAYLQITLIAVIGSQNPQKMAREKTPIFGRSHHHLAAAH